MMFLPISVPGKVAASTKSSFEVRAFIIASQINLTKMSAFFQVLPRHGIDDMP